MVNMARMGTKQVCKVLGVCRKAKDKRMFNAELAEKD
jgi:hypothetical protein